MKRHPHLVQLSREHHAALRLGRHLLAGGAAAELRAEHAALLAHFAEEEDELAPMLERHGHGALATRLRAEHVHLRSLFKAAVNGGAEAEAEAGQALIDHVRFEERELFPVIETLLEETPP
ncbi:hemerythrin domain-containing protein [Thauera mechernichensis]|uniref:Hemerythrin domain-containing protein n=1 Tax=Thauera mechernichensis TaxID=82788 RepID=A0ABW3W9U0_9RHOO|nr:hemerythrin domain-containing protein [Thauera mechernichensis]MDG3063641.1 hemerythrin domain-containing protein [Thauera mechernichensis]